MERDCLIMEMNALKNITRDGNEINPICSRVLMMMLLAKIESQELVSCDFDHLYVIVS